jgi:hypothetical protein
LGTKKGRKKRKPPPSRMIKIPVDQDLKILHTESEE